MNEKTKWKKIRAKSVCLARKSIKGAPHRATEEESPRGVDIHISATGGNEIGDGSEEEREKRKKEERRRAAGHGRLDKFDRCRPFDGYWAERYIQLPGLTRDARRNTITGRSFVFP